MVYPIVCIMPSNRSFLFQGGALVVISDGSPSLECCNLSSSGGHNIDHNSQLSARIDSVSADIVHEDGGDRDAKDDEVRIAVHGEDSSISCFGYEEIGCIFGFTYIPRLIFLHESDLRNYDVWGLDCSSLHNDEDPDTDNIILDESCLDSSEGQDISIVEATPALINQLVKGGIHPHLYIRKIPDIGDIKVGNGLFTSESIIAGALIGEYVGILLTSMPEPSSYSLNYPCSDGNHEINASEYGNVTRFINHSAAANCSFKHVFFEGIAHVVCVSIYISNSRHKFQ